MAATGSSFEEWLNWEAFLACKAREADYPFAEVAAKPAYGTEGLVGEDGAPDRTLGDLRIGASHDPGEHRWVFVEFALLHDGNRRGGKWWQKVEGDAAKLRRLGWKRSAALLVVVAVGRGDVTAEWADDFARSQAWNLPPVAPEFWLALPGGGSLVVRAFDIKQNPGDTMVVPAVG